MSKLDFLRLFSQYEDDIDFGDFSPEELQEMLEAYHSEGEAEKPLTSQEFKERYFSFYDDVKDKSLKKQDW